MHRDEMDYEFFARRRYDQQVEDERKAAEQARLLSWRDQLRDLLDRSAIWMSEEDVAQISSVITDIGSALGEPAPALIGAGA